jgi:HSP20 family protein
MADTTKRGDTNDDAGLSTRSSSSVINQLDRFFNETLQDPFTLPTLLNTQRLMGGIHFPKVDVTENEKEIKVTANIPGVDPEKIDIEVGDDYISLSGRVEKETTEEDKRAKIYNYEREYGEFQRQFALPARVNRDGITAKARNGILTITLPKLQEEKKNKIEVEVEK